MICNIHIRKREIRYLFYKLKIFAIRHFMCNDWIISRVRDIRYDSFRESFREGETRISNSVSYSGVFNFPARWQIKHLRGERQTVYKYRTVPLPIIVVHQCAEFRRLRSITVPRLIARPTTSYASSAWLPLFITACIFTSSTEQIWLDVSTNLYLKCGRFFLMERIFAKDHSLSLLWLLTLNIWDIKSRIKSPLKWILSQLNQVVRSIITVTALNLQLFWIFNDDECT